MLNISVCPADDDHYLMRPSENYFGETALAYAPTVRLSNGEQAVPQQFLDVNRRLGNLSNVLAEISLPSEYILFAGEEGSCLYIIVGAIGRENYVGYRNSIHEDKIVYGRRWLIEPSTPTSEIVQTALLAVQKVREHEARELLTLRINNGVNVSTPFNCHLDLPLMEANRSMLTKSESSVTEVLDETAIRALLTKVKFAGFSFELVKTVNIANKLVFEVHFIGVSKHFTELAGRSLAVVCERQDNSDFLHQLMNAIIQQSDRFIEEELKFKDFARFSHKLAPQELAEFSYSSRNIKVTDPRFDQNFEDMSYRVDAAKAPAYNDGCLGEKQKAIIKGFDDLAGHLPSE